MLKIGVAGCGLQAATIASYVGVYGDEYQVSAVMDLAMDGAKVRMKQKSVAIAPDCAFCSNMEEFLPVAKAKNLDGIIIGTYCAFHTEVACALEPLGIPLYNEKPVAVTLDQVKHLYNTFKKSATPIQVSLPMRLCPLAQKAKSIIDSGAVGKIYQVAGFEDTDGEVYFTTWFRDYEKTGGMFMQKAVHDIDYMLYLAGAQPVEVCAMRSKIFYRGDKPYHQTCRECPDKLSCQHGPAFRFDKRGLADSCMDAEEYLSTVKAPDGTILRPRYCAVSKEIAIEDIGECIIRTNTGAHISHTQNFIASMAAARRGARFVGGLGSLDIDFNHGKLKFMSSVNNDVSEYSVDGGKLSHYGGDRALIQSFIRTMRTGERGITDLIAGNGVMSTLACLCARESADRGVFMKTEF